MFSLICAWMNCWANIRDARDLRRHCAHYDVIVMAWNRLIIPISFNKTQQNVNHVRISLYVRNTWKDITAVYYGNLNVRLYWQMKSVCYVGPMPNNYSALVGHIDSINVAKLLFLVEYAQWINSLGPSDAIWRSRSWSTLVKVMACCLTAPSHYLNQCWLIISKVLWHSSEDIIIRKFEDTNQ